MFMVENKSKEYVMSRRIARLTAEQVEAIVADYERDLEKLGAEKICLPDSVKIGQDRRDIVNHIYFSCGEIRRHLEVGLEEVAKVELAFMQGILWSMGLFSLNELLGHTQNDTAEKP